MAHKLDDKGRRDPNLNNRRIQEVLPEWFVADNIKLMNMNDFKQCDNLGRNAIHAACFKGYSEMLKYMLNSFSDSEKIQIANKTDNNGCTPAHYSCGLSWGDTIDNIMLS